MAGRCPRRAPAGAPAARPRVTCARSTARDALAWLDDANRRIAWLPFPNSDRCMAAQVRPLTLLAVRAARSSRSASSTGTPTQIHSLIDLDPALRDAEALARALRAAHPDAFAPPILRDDLGGEALRRAGLRASTA